MLRRWGAWRCWCAGSRWRRGASLVLVLCAAVTVGRRWGPPADALPSEFHPPPELAAEPPPAGGSAPFPVDYLVSGTYLRRRISLTATMTTIATTTAIPTGPSMVVES